MKVVQVCVLLFIAHAMTSDPVKAAMTSGAELLRQCEYAISLRLEKTRQPVGRLMNDVSTIAKWPDAKTRAHPEDQALASFDRAADRSGQEKIESECAQARHAFGSNPSRASSFPHGCSVV